MLSAKNQSIQRIIVNSISLVYWLPAVSNDLKYPTQDVKKMCVKYLTTEWNWTEGYLDQRYSYLKNLKDQIAQMSHLK